MKRTDTIDDGLRILAFLIASTYGVGADSAHMPQPHASEPQANKITGLQDSRENADSDPNYQQRSVTAAFCDEDGSGEWEEFETFLAETLLREIKSDEAE